MYTAAVIAVVEDLYIVATPNLGNFFYKNFKKLFFMNNLFLGIKYDAVKEEKQAQEVKQMELHRIEEQRKEKRSKCSWILSSRLTQPHINFFFREARVCAAARFVCGEAGDASVEEFASGYSRYPHSLRGRVHESEEAFCYGCDVALVGVSGK